ncbi:MULTISPECIES: O-methyltransferase [Micromonospora]|uniref:O-methyltransferase n=1 Tax=unclassified Micromonospora TaxID=2617518 RepID=UPI0027DFE70F|nr:MULTISPECIES: O-methyltransferase [Micromonospora]
MPTRPRTTHRPRRCPIATVAGSGSSTTQAQHFAESYVTEDLVLRTARSLAREVGLDAVTPGAGAALRLLAAAGNARAVVEIGTGTGVSGVWLLRGMRVDGVLTTIDVEVEHQRIARRIFAEAGFAAGRTRIITGRALDVLPRLADGAYDLVFVDAEATGFHACVEAALRLLRPGGVLALNGVLASGRIGDPSARDAETVTVRETIKAVRESEHWIPALLPVGHGLLAAVKC